MGYLPALVEKGERMRRATTVRQDASIFENCSEFFYTKYNKSMRGSCYGILSLGCLFLDTDISAFRVFYSGEEVKGGEGRGNLIPRWGPPPQNIP